MSSFWIKCYFFSCGIRRQIIVPNPISDLICIPKRSPYFIFNLSFTLIIPTPENRSVLFEIGSPHKTFWHIFLVIPTPSSQIKIFSTAPRGLTVILMLPSPFGTIPWNIAFSTRGCNRSFKILHCKTSPSISCTN